MTKYLTTESGDRLLTESGDNIILEYMEVSVATGVVLTKTLVGMPLIVFITAWSTNLTNIEVKNATSYPEFHLRGPGTLFAIENHTTRKGLYFNNLELSPNDYIIVRVDPVSGLSMSGFFNLMDYLSPVSDTELPLSPGENNLSVTYETSFELTSGSATLENFLVNGLNAENTNNGEAFTVRQVDPGAGANQVLTFEDYDGATLAEGYAQVGSSSLCYLQPSSESGVSGSIVPDGGAWSATTASATFSVGLASVVWKNRRWSIDEVIED